MRRFLVFTLTLGLVTSGFTGCGSSTAVSALGLVTDITDTTIVLALGAEQEVPVKDGQAATPGGMGQAATPGEMGQAEVPEEERPDGVRPGGDMTQGERTPFGLELSGEELTLSITEDTSVMEDQGEDIVECEISEVVVGDIVSVTYYKNDLGAITVVIQAPEGAGGFVGKPPEGIGAPPEGADTFPENKDMNTEEENQSADETAMIPAQTKGIFI